MLRNGSIYKNQFALSTVAGLLPLITAPIKAKQPMSVTRTSIWRKHFIVSVVPRNIAKFH